MLGDVGWQWRTCGGVGKWCLLPCVTLKTLTNDVPMNPGINRLVSQVVLEQGPCAHQSFSPPSVQCTLVPRFFSKAFIQIWSLSPRFPPLPPLYTSPSCVLGHTQPIPERSQAESCGPSASRGQSGAERGGNQRAAEALAGDGDGNCGNLAEYPSVLKEERLFSHLALALASWSGAHFHVAGFLYRCLCGLLKPVLKGPRGLVSEGLAAAAGRWAWGARARLSLRAAG